MTDKTLERLLLWSEGGRGAITISAAFGGAIEVRAERKTLHGHGDHQRNGSSQVDSTVHASVHTRVCLVEGLDKAINDAIDECDAALKRWPPRVP